MFRSLEGKETDASSVHKNKKSQLKVLPVQAKKNINSFTADEKKEVNERVHLSLLLSCSLLVNTELKKSVM